MYHMVTMEVYTTDIFDAFQFAFVVYFSQNICITYMRSKESFTYDQNQDGLQGFSLLEKQKTRSNSDQWAEASEQKG